MIKNLPAGLGAVALGLTAAESGLEAGTCKR
jgi:hypothetical protein